MRSYPKLIIQMPCYNEAETLAQTIGDLPSQIGGIGSIEILVIDDGSTDGTKEVAKHLGVDHILSYPTNRGLAYAFAAGLEEAIKLGADIIVNTDGDNQYQGAQVGDLVQPILEGTAHLVVGERDISRITHFSRTKKILQRFGSWVVRWASGTDVIDTTSGFRALTRDAALRLNVFASYTYTLDTLIQAGKKGIPVVSVPVSTNPKLRDSRLISSTLSYVMQSSVTILRIFLMYEALRVFVSLGSLSLLAGLLLMLRFGYFYSIGEGQGHVQSLIVAAVLILVGFQTYLLGLIADLIAKNRRLSEDATYRLKKMDLEMMSKAVELESSEPES